MKTDDKILIKKLRMQRHTASLCGDFEAVELFDLLAHRLTKLDKPAQPMRGAGDEAIIENVMVIARNLRDAKYHDDADKLVAIVKRFQEIIPRKYALRSQISDDMVLMPREPTESMVMKSSWGRVPCFVRDAYKEMIAAWEKEQKK